MYLVCDGSCVIPTGMYLLTGLLGTLSCGSLTVKHLEPFGPYYITSPITITLQELCLWIEKDRLGRFALDKALTLWSEPFHIETCMTSDALELNYTILASSSSRGSHLAPVIIAISLSLLVACLLAAVHSYLLLGGQRK